MILIHTWLYSMHHATEQLHARHNFPFIFLISIHGSRYISTLMLGLEVDFRRAAMRWFHILMMPMTSYHHLHAEVTAEARFISKARHRRYAKQRRPRTLSMLISPHFTFYRSLAAADFWRRETFEQLELSSHFPTLYSFTYLLPLMPFRQRHS